MVKKYIICLSYLILSCDNISKNSKKRKQLPSNILEDIEIMETQDSLVFNDLKVLNKIKAVEKYGKPFKYDSFILNDGPTEFRIELLNIYSKEEVLSNTIKIEELTWEKDSLNFITVWYDEMTPKDIYVWDKRTEF
ncbi:hypothetical protein [Tenacibaculum maritimum]|uniref:hypothetical protein n=1 Tax=Tenacibaculum maritimum TaxID=107401 RepID=UPI003876DE79